MLLYNTTQVLRLLQKSQYEYEVVKIDETV
jgi:hypothetical protein